MKLMMRRLRLWLRGPLHARVIDIPPPPAGWKPPHQAPIWNGPPGYYWPPPRSNDNLPPRVVVPNQGYEA